VDGCFFWFQPTRVVPDKGPLNGCVCVCINNLCKGVMNLLEAGHLRLREALIKRISGSLESVMKMVVQPVVELS